MKRLDLRICLIVVCCTALLSCLALAASAQEGASRLTFDVATIRLSAPGEQNGFIKPLPGGQGYLAHNITPKLMISLMFKIPMHQIQGGPTWMNEAHYDVEARADHPFSTDDLHTMYQNLLIDRFSLKFHKEAKEGPAYILTVDPAGLKMKTSQHIGPDYNIPMNGSPEHTVGRDVPMNYFCWWLAQQLQHDERPVLDRTGLTGKYDFDISFARELSPGAAGADNAGSVFPSIFTALKEQLGLKLQAEKDTVEYYVIDSMEKPSDN
jgi:uncharacterized protein (TIGR03435 family)